MTFMDLVKNRESARKFLDKPVPRELLDRCVEAARLAPSACNSQPWKFIVVDEPDLRKQVAATTYSKIVSFNRFTENAGALVAVTTEKSKMLAQIGGFLKDKPYYLLDIGIAVEHFCLQATEDGLGTCILGWFDEKAVRRLLRVPTERRVPLIIAVGYTPFQEPRNKKRKDLDIIRSYNLY